MHVNRLTVLLAIALAAKLATSSDVQIEMHAMSATELQWYWRQTSNRVSTISLVVQNDGPSMPATLTVSLGPKHGKRIDVVEFADLPGSSKRRIQVYGPTGIAGQKITAVLRSKGATEAEAWCIVGRQPEFIVLDRRPMVVRPLSPQISPSNSAPPPLWALPDSHCAYRGGRAIILGNVRTEDLSPNQTQAIVRYVRHGGTLIVLAGERGPSLLQSFVGELLPGATCRVTEAQSLSSLAARLRKPAPPRGPIVCGAIDGPGIEQELVQDGVPIISTRRVLLGRVIWVGVDLGSRALQAWTAVEPLCHELTAGPRDETHLQCGHYRRPRDLRPDPTPFTWVLVFFTIYLACLGPGVFFVLRRLKAPMAIWIVVPALALGFLVLTPTIRLGLEYAASNLFSTTVVERLPNCDLAYFRFYGQTFSRGKEEHHLSLPDVDGSAMLGSFARRTWGSGRLLASRGEGLTINPLSVPMWGSRVLQVEGAVKDVPTVSGRVVAVSGSQWRVELHNYSDVLVPNGVILMPCDERNTQTGQWRGVHMPAIPAGETRTVVVGSKSMIQPPAFKLLPFEETRTMSHIWVEGCAAFVTTGQLTSDDVSDDENKQRLKSSWELLRWPRIELDRLIEWKLDYRVLVVWLPIEIGPQVSGKLDYGLIQPTIHTEHRTPSSGRWQIHSFRLPPGLATRVIGLRTRVRYDNRNAGKGRVEVYDWQRQAWDVLRLPKPKQQTPRGRQRRQRGVSSQETALPATQRYVQEANGLILIRDGSGTRQPSPWEFGRRVEIEVTYGRGKSGP